ncbi:hypothetical protein HSB1_44330 [Halogranum salarium B-1]|uniref:Uncharacterized protein n=1 Tax=Halogranum salarium B-1 TaxID=1210908 RepID=J3ESS9_9EURY|nr:hypothetical protein HSB1_44330 [Halogranum salarium B-1]
MYKIDVRIRLETHDETNGSRVPNPRERCPLFDAFSFFFSERVYTTFRYNF